MWMQVQSRETCRRPQCDVGTKVRLHRNVPQLLRVRARTGVLWSRPLRYHGVEEGEMDCNFDK